MKKTKEISMPKMLWDMLGCQYKPLEKSVLEEMEELGLEKQIKQYQELSIERKITFLDDQARQRGL